MDLLLLWARWLALMAIWTWQIVDKGVGTIKVYIKLPSSMNSNVSGTGAAESDVKKCLKVRQALGTWKVWKLENFENIKNDILGWPGSIKIFEINMTDKSFQQFTRIIFNVFKVFKFSGFQVFGFSGFQVFKVFRFPAPVWLSGIFNVALLQRLSCFSYFDQDFLGPSLLSVSCSNTYPTQ